MTKIVGIYHALDGDPIIYGYDQNGKSIKHRVVSGQAERALSLLPEAVKQRVRSLML